VRGKWLFGFIAYFASNAACDEVVAERPNVIVVMTDDQGYPELSVHGNPVLQTPHLDSLHDESLRLTDYHVAPMCTPTRGQLLTGIDAARNGAINVSSGRALLRPEIPTIANYFGDAGYATGYLVNGILARTIHFVRRTVAFRRACGIPLRPFPLFQAIGATTILMTSIFTTAQKNSFRVTAPMCFLLKQRRS